MSIENVRAYLQKFGLEKRIREFPVSSATVELPLRLWVAHRHALPKRFLSIATMKFCFW